ncbi:uncharacterized protein TM35_000771060, partial [Trypanosoma theileri]
AGGALRVRPAAESEWLTCGAGSRVSACGKYADLCSQQRTARAATTTTIIGTTTVNANDGQPKAVMANAVEWSDLFITASRDHQCRVKNDTKIHNLNCSAYKKARIIDGVSDPTPDLTPAQAAEKKPGAPQPLGEEVRLVEEAVRAQDRSLTEVPSLTTSTVTHSDPVIIKNNPLIASPIAASDEPGNGETGTGATPTPRQTHGSTTAPQSDNEAPNKGNSAPAVPDSRGTSSTTPPRTENQITEQNTPTESNSSPGSSNPTQQPSPAGTTSKSGSEETTSTTPPLPKNTVSEAPSITPSPVSISDSEFSSSSAPTVHNKANVDSSISPVWMRTAAPLLIVAVLVSVTVY